eukprot:2467381-Rhodomonas_salina.1
MGSDAHHVQNQQGAHALAGIGASTGQTPSALRAMSKSILVVLATEMLTLPARANTGTEITQGAETTPMEEWAPLRQEDLNYIWCSCWVPPEEGLCPC